MNAVAGLEDATPVDGSVGQNTSHLTSHIHHITRTKSIAEASNLNKWIPQSEGSSATGPSLKSSSSCLGCCTTRSC